MRDLDRLEAESIHILREVAAECRNPVLLYSTGKDSSVLLHLLLKASALARPSIPLLQVDTTWKFRKMIAFRDQRVVETGVELRVHINPDGIRDNVGPQSHGASVHTEVMKTSALKQALDAGGSDAAIGGARRDEEKSRAKERVFSFRDARHRWEPRRQRPALWNLYNARVCKGKSVRLFPRSDWTRLDVWRYIRRENTAAVPLYFAKPSQGLSWSAADGLRRADNIHWQQLDVDGNARAELNGQRPRCIWFTGLSGAGKSTIANLVERGLFARGLHT